MFRSHRDEGFTLIELLIVIAILGILAAAVLVAVDPVGRIQEARDARRAAEVNGLLNAVLNEQVDARALYDGNAPATVAGSSKVQVIVSSVTGIDCTVPASAPVCTGQTLVLTGTDTCVVDIHDLAPNYIAAIPVDPRGAGQNPAGSGLPLGATNTGYYMSRDSAGRITIGACYPEKTSAVSVSR